ncbi:hypothetical protein XENTR_v10018376 [Xenopus tropicalis]|nr:hypothetical protein XENTR_v10018376 [Xenopus tropicalis]
MLLRKRSYSTSIVIDFNVSGVRKKDQLTFMHLELHISSPLLLNQIKHSADMSGAKGGSGIIGGGGCGGSSGSSGGLGCGGSGAISTQCGNTGINIPVQPCQGTVQQGGTANPCLQSQGGGSFISGGGSSYGGGCGGQIGGSSYGVGCGGQTGGSQISGSSCGGGCGGQTGGSGYGGGCGGQTGGGSAKK